MTLHCNDRSSKVNGTLFHNSSNEERKKAATTVTLCEGKKYRGEQKILGNLLLQQRTSTKSQKRMPGNR